jgi:DNA-binding response OmpR family regulator
VKQCAVLYVGQELQPTTHVEYLRALGFVVHQAVDWPANDSIRDYHVVIVRLGAVEAAPMLAARLRAKPHFGRRVLLALVDPDASLGQRRAAAASGFDEVLTDRCDSRQLTARILRHLRSRPELRCALPAA